MNYLKKIKMVYFHKYYLKIIQYTLNHLNYQQLIDLVGKIGLKKEYGNEIAIFIRKNIPYGQELTLPKFEKIFYKKYNKDKWQNNIIDVIFAMSTEPYNLLKLEIYHGKIKSIIYKR